MFDCENDESALTRLAGVVLSAAGRDGVWILGNIGRFVHERVSTMTWLRR